MAQSIAFFDIDNTLYEGFSYYDLLEKQVGEGLLDAKVLQDGKAAGQKLVDGKQDYETTVMELLDIYAAGLKGREYETVLQSTKDFYAGSKKFFAYAHPVVDLLRESHVLAVVTGEPQFVAEAVRELFGMQEHVATEFEVENGVFTGAVSGYLATRHEKHDAIQHLVRSHHMKGSFAFGDSDGDIEMLRVVDYPICLNTTDPLRAEAEKHKWHTPDAQAVVALVRELLDRPNDEPVDL
jgi:HAD superfamily hydrolase (TIGR01490 family)